MGTPLGSIVGYSIRLDECFDRNTTKVKFMTEGILVSILLYLVEVFKGGMSAQSIFIMLFRYEKCSVVRIFEFSFENSQTHIRVFR